MTTTDANTTPAAAPSTDADGVEQLRVEDLVDLALDAAIDVARAESRASTLKGMAVAAAERIRLTVGLVDRFPSQQKLGTLRLDGADRPPTVRVNKPEEFADWLAQRDSGAVTASITVPADQLEAALAALEFAAIPGVTSSVTPAPAAAADFLDQRCIVQMDPDTRDWTVLHVDDERHTHVVPGVTATPAVPRWVLTPASDKKRTAIEEAEAEVRNALAAQDVAQDAATSAEPA